MALAALLLISTLLINSILGQKRVIGPLLNEIFARWRRCFSASRSAGRRDDQARPVAVFGGREVERGVASLCIGEGEATAIAVEMA